MAIRKRLILNLLMTHSSLLGLQGGGVIAAVSSPTNKRKNNTNNSSRIVNWVTFGGVGAINFFSLSIIVLSVYMMATLCANPTQQGKVSSF